MKKNKTRLERNILYVGFVILFIINSCSQTDGSQIQSKTMKFRASLCDPFQADIIEFGEIQKDKIIEKFESISWVDFLSKMELVKPDEIFYSPSLEIENIENKQGLSISAVGEPSKYEFYIFYKRPKKVKKFFGLKEKINEDYTSDITGQTKQDVLECLNALLRNDTEFLENKIGL